MPLHCRLTSLRVLSRFLQANSLNGTIPTSIYQLTSLTAMYVSVTARSITAFFSQSSCALSRFLYKNQLIGTISSDIGQLTALKKLWVVLSLSLSTPIDCKKKKKTKPNRSFGTNKLDGIIPSSITQLTALEELCGSVVTLNDLVVDSHAPPSPQGSWIIIN